MIDDRILELKSQIFEFLAECFSMCRACETPVPFRCGICRVNAVVERLERLYDELKSLQQELKSCE